MAFVKGLCDSWHKQLVKEDQEVRGDEEEVWVPGRAGVKRQQQFIRGITHILLFKVIEYS